MIGWMCPRCGTGYSPFVDRCYCGPRAVAATHTTLNFKVSDTPHDGPEGISGHPATAGPHEHKEIA